MLTDFQVLGLINSPLNNQFHKWLNVTTEVVGNMKCHYAEHRN